MRAVTLNVTLIALMVASATEAQESPSNGLHEPVAAATATDRISIWDMQKASKIDDFTVTDVSVGMGGNWRIFDVVWNRDGTQLAAATAVIRSSIGQVLQADGYIQIWDMNNEQAVRTIVLRGHVGAVTSLAWSTSGKRMASASDDGTVKLWDVSTHAQTASAPGMDAERELLTLRGHESEVLSVAWNDDGTQLVSADVDGMIRLWDARAGYARSFSEALLPRLDQNISSGTVSVEDLQLRAEIRASLGQWDDAAADFEQVIQRSPRASTSRWLVSSWWLAGPYPGEFDASFPPESQTDPLQPISVLQRTSEDATSDLWRKSMAMLRRLPSISRDATRKPPPPMLPAAG